MTGPQPSAVTPRDVAVESCDVCIVGAGLAGLNALFVASRYLSREQKVILVDRRERVGGMWVDTYSYVRLHQPHPMFTAGNIKWTLGQDRSYLATKGEVLDHFEHCLNVRDCPTATSARANVKVVRRMLGHATAAMLPKGVAESSGLAVKAPGAVAQLVRAADS